MYVYKYVCMQIKKTSRHCEKPLALRGKVQLCLSSGAAICKFSIICLSASFSLYNVGETTLLPSQEESNEIRYMKAYDKC